MQAIKAADVQSDINVTPLVDVVLVLLIIFMVVTPMLQKGQAVKLPMTESPEAKPEDKSQVLVALTQAKDYWIDKNKYSEAQFVVQIKEVFDRNQSANVVVKADSRLTYGDVKKTLMKIKDAGFTNVGLITEKRQKA
jgi:biopolymer transport protein ExbD